jgi:hypothetical protein
MAQSYLIKEEVVTLKLKANFFIRDANKKKALFSRLSEKTRVKDIDVFT